MSRDEFEVKYAMKYWGGDFTHNPTSTLDSMKENRSGSGYEDRHIDLCWKIQQIQDDRRRGSRSDAIEALEW